MSSFTLDAAPRFPSGSTVQVYVEEAFVNGSGPTTASVTSAVVAPAGTVVFTGLADERRYVAAQLQSGRWVKTRFMISLPEVTLDGLQAELDAEEVIIAALQAAIDSLGGTGTPGESLLPELFEAGDLTAQGNSPYWSWKQPGTDVLFVAFTNGGFVAAYDISADYPVRLGDTISQGSLGTIGYITGKGDYLYTTDQNNLLLKIIHVTVAAGVATFSISSSTAYSSGSSGGARLDITPNGQYVLIGGPEAGVNANKHQLMDVTVPTAPVPKGTIVAGTISRDIAAISNTHWAVGSRDDHKAYIIDATNPLVLTNPATITLVGETTTGLEMDYATSTLYAGGYGTGIFEAWNVANPVVPVFLDSIFVALNIEQVALDFTNRRAFVGCRNVGVMGMIDITDPSNLAVIDTISFPGVPPSITTPGVAVRDDGVYAYVMDASDPQDGHIHVILAKPTVGLIAAALHRQVVSGDSVAAQTLKAQTWPSTQTLSASIAMILSGTQPKIRFGVDDLQQLTAGNLRWNGTITMLFLLMFGSGAVFRTKVAESDADFAFQIDGAGGQRWGNRTDPHDCRLNRLAAAVLQAETCDFAVGTAGKGLRVKEGTNAKQGLSQLVAGTVVVATTAVTANSRIQLTSNVDGGAPGWLRVSARTAGTSFTILSSSGTDTSFVAWEIFEPA